MKPLCYKYCREEFDEKGTIKSFEINCPDDFNFAYDVVDKIAEEEPDKTALIWCNNKGEERIFSFADISALSNKAANYLTKCGITRGDRVMLILKRHYEYWYTITALHKIGAVAIPASYMLRSEDISYRIKTASIKSIICAEDTEVTDNVLIAAKECGIENNLYNIRCDCEGFKRFDLLLEKESSTFERIPNKTTDPFIMYFTSGTTGFPKAVVHNYSYPLAHIVTAKHWQNVEDGGVHMSVSDTGWGKASWGKIYGQWLCGAAVLVYDYVNFNPADLMDMVVKYNVSTFCAPPTFFRFLVKSGLDKYDFSTLHYVTTAGEALSPDIYQSFYEHTGIEIKEGYGQTETTLILGNFTGTNVKRSSMGKPSPMYNVMIVDEDCRKVEKGEIGEIVIVPDEHHQYGLLDRYDGDKEATDTAWRGGVYHTCDMAYCDEDGYFWFIGRTDDIIKSCGYRISPFEVESVISNHPAVFECAVTGVPDDKRGFVIKASIVLQKGYSGTKDLAREIQIFVKKETAEYKAPRIIEFVDELPKTSSGKIMRYKIRNQE